MSCRTPCRLFIHEIFFGLLGLHLRVWSELGRSPPFQPMRALRMQGSRAFSLVCEVALNRQLQTSIQLIWSPFTSPILELTMKVAVMQWSLEQAIEGLQLADATVEGRGLRATSHTSQEPVTMKLWEPKRNCPKAVPTHLQNRVMWSRTPECSVKS